MDSETRPAMVAAEELSAPERVRNRALIARRIVGIGLGALLVAIAAQVVVPMVPVPITLQPLAVLVVGGLLGAGGGISALVLYLFLGAIGLPVYAGGAAGAIHLIGPTGGYLLAFPVAAGVTGAIVSRHPSSVLRVLLACALGMAIIHVGGVAQLAFLGGDPSLAFRVGFLPFLTGDLIKVGLAAALILVAGSKVRSLL